MFFKRTQIDKKLTPNLLEQNQEVIYNIQALKYESVFYNNYVALSFGLLFVIALVYFIQQKKTPFFSILPFLISEQESFRLFSTREKFGVKEYLILGFFILQTSFLLFHFLDLKAFSAFNFVEKHWQIFIFAFILLIVTLLKVFVSNQLNTLIRADFNIRYYRFAYFYPIFLFSLLLFVIALIDSNFGIQNIANLYLSVVICFYVWLIIRWVFISVRYQAMKSVYFFLYLCALEMAPLLMLIGLSQY